MEQWWTLLACGLPPISQLPCSNLNRVPAQCRQRKPISLRLSARALPTPPPPVTMSLAPAKRVPEPRPAHHAVSERPTKRPKVHHARDPSSDPASGGLRVGPAALCATADRDSHLRPLTCCATDEQRCLDQPVSVPPYAQLKHTIFRCPLYPPRSASCIKGASFVSKHLLSGCSNLPERRADLS